MFYCYARMANTGPASPQTAVAKRGTHSRSQERWQRVLDVAKAGMWAHCRGTSEG